MNIGLTAAELTDIRTAIADLLPDTCTLLSVTNTRDAVGGVVETYGTAGTSPCRVDPIVQMKPYEALGAGAVAPFHRYMLTLPYNSTVTTEMRVSVNGETFNVISADDPKSWEGSRRVILEQI